MKCENPGGGKIIYTWKDDRRLPGESNLLAGTSRKTGGEPKKGR